MNKKLFLLPILSLSLLVGCAGKPASQSTSQSGSQSQSESGSGSQGQKEIWEEDEVEGESTIAQVKAGEAGQYYTVRGTVVANSGSTLAIYRKGQFLYCYNFKADAHENLKAHPLGAYVEIHAQSSVYSNSVQLTAYSVGEEKTDAGYDKAATLKVLQERGEEVAPVVTNTAADLANGPATGKLMKFDFVPKKDVTLAADAADNQDIDGYVGETAVTLRLEKYCDSDVKTALLTANPAKFEIGATYEVVSMGAARSDGIVRGILCEGSSWRKTADASFAEPTSVDVAVKDNAEASVQVGKKLQLEFLVNPDGARQEVVWSSENEALATVDDTGLVSGVAEGTVKIYAAAVGKETVKGEISITVTPKPATVYTYTKLEKFAFASDLTKYEAYNAEAMQAFLKAASDLGAETNYVSHSVAGAATMPLIGANGGSGDAAWSNYNLLKLGSSSKNSHIELTFKDAVSIGKISFKAAGWPGKEVKLGVNDETPIDITAGEHATIKDGTAFKDYEITFEPGHVIDLQSTLCVMITEITFYTATPQE